MAAIESMSAFEIFALLWIGGALTSTTILLWLMKNAPTEDELNGRE